MHRLNASHHRNDRLKKTLIFLSACVLAACGGGGAGGSSTNQGITPVVPAAVVTPIVEPVTAQSLMKSLNAQLLLQKQTTTQHIQALYELDANSAQTANSLNAVDWNPTHDSSTINILDSGSNQAILMSNWAYRPQTANNSAVLGVIGKKPAAQAAYAVFGGNPLAERGNAQMDRLMKNTIAALTPKSKNANFKVVTAHLPGKHTYWFPHELKVSTWFAEQYPGVSVNGGLPAQNTEDKCDGTKLSACLETADLLVIGREQGPSGANSEKYPTDYDGSTIMQAVKSAHDKGVPILYLHHYRVANDLDTKLLNYFGLSINNNYSAIAGLKSFSPVANSQFSEQTDTLLSFISRLSAGNFTSNWSGCFNDLGFIKCESTDTNVRDEAYTNEFAIPAKKIRSKLRDLDAQGIRLFAEPGYELEKTLVLLGDKFRETVSYPMTKEASGLGFYQAYFSDMVAYVNRPSNQVAQNLGNFSGLFSANTATLARTINVTTTPNKKLEWSTGLYVMPGRTVTVTRTDPSSATVTVGLNMLRDTTRVFNTYERPTLLKSAAIGLKTGSPLVLTSPFGGPLMLYADASVNPADLVVHVDGVITHPILRNANDAAQVAAFKDELSKTPTNWVVVATDELTVHSNLKNFNTSLKNYNDSLNHLIGDINTYMIKDTYDLAGFKSKSATPLLPAVSTVCNGFGWDCVGVQHVRDLMQHVISDNYAACGAGCSGNPYDQNVALNPLGWLESHEIGHNLQVQRLNIYAELSAEVSNNIFPIHKQMVYNRTVNPAVPLSRTRGAAKPAFDIMKAALLSANPSAEIKKNIWSDPAYAANNDLRVLFYRQLADYARHYKQDFADGWELYTLLYLLNRNFALAEPKWNEVKSSFGFSTYTAYPSSMDGNDFIVVAASKIIGRDMRPMFDLWGITYSSAASAQVDDFKFLAVEKLLFPMVGVTQPHTGIAPIVMGVNAVYPAGF